MAGSSLWLRLEDLSEDWDEYLYCSECEVEQVTKTAPKVVNKYEGYISDDDTEEVRYSKTGKDKVLDDLSHTTNSIRSKIAVNDWNGIVTDWEIVLKCISKLDSYLENNTPTWFVYFLFVLNNSLKEKTITKDRTLSVTNSKSLIRVRSRFQKWLGSNSFWASCLEKYNNNPIYEEITQSSVESKSQKSATLTTAVAKPKLQGRERWLKRDDATSSSSEDDNDWIDQSDSGSDTAKKAAIRKNKNLDSDSAAKPTSKPQKSQIVWDAATIDTMHKQLLSTRGTKKYNLLEQLETFKLLIEKTKEKAYTHQRLLCLLSSLVDAQFDFNTNVFSFLNVKMWIFSFNTIYALFNLFKIVSACPELAQLEEVVQIGNVLVSQVEHLDDEYIRSLHFIDVYSKDYSRHLPRELALLRLINEVYQFFFNSSKAVLLASRLLDHLYYRHEDENDIQIQAYLNLGLDREPLDPQKHIDGYNSGELAYIDGPEFRNLKEHVNSLVHLIFKSSNDSLKHQAALQYVYHLALHDQYFAADTILSSKLQEDISSKDVNLQVLYNRALVQVGLAAFRRGLNLEAHYLLSDIASCGHTRELLAQGIVNRTSEKTTEQEKLEKRRQLPHVMHINTDVLDFAHLTSAMLLEVTNMASKNYDQFKRIISKTIRKALERHLNLGPPENTRERVYVAAKVLFQGDWKKCSELILGADVWKAIHNAESVKKILEMRIKEEALKIYMLTSGQYYDSISLEYLASSFDLDIEKVYTFISKMIVNNELNYSWDQLSNCLIPRGQQLSYLQYLSLHLTEKLTSLIDSSDSSDSRIGYGKDRWEDRTNQRRDERPYRMNSNVYGSQRDKNYVFRFDKKGANTESGYQRKSNMNAKPHQRVKRS